MTLADFIADADTHEPIVRAAMLESALTSAIGHMTYQMMFAHEKDLKALAEFYAKSRK